MTLAAKLTEQEVTALPELIRKEYKQGEDKFFYPDVAEKDGWAFENVTGLRTTMRDERARREEWERKHGELARTLNGLDPKEITELPGLKKKLKEMESWTPEEKVQARILGLEGEYKTKLSDAERTRLEEISTREKEIRELLVDARARVVLSGLDAIDVEMLLPHVHRDVRVERKDGKSLIIVVDDHGDPVTTKKAGAVGNMQLEELLEGYKKKWPNAFKGTGATGGGTSGSGAGGSGDNTQHPNSADLNKLTPEQRLTQLRRMGVKR